MLAESLLVAMTTTGLLSCHRNSKAVMLICDIITSVLCFEGPSLFSFATLGDNSSYWFLVFSTHKFRSKVKW